MPIVAAMPTDVAINHDWGWVLLVALSALAGIALLLVYPAMVLRKYIRIMVNILDDHAPNLENGNGHADSDRNGEEVSFAAADGHPLRGIVLPGRGERKPGLVVFAHEFGRDRMSCMRYCGPLLDAGYDVFTFDFRGHGRSAPEANYTPRQWPSDREGDDMRGAIRFIGDWLERHGRSRAVGLFGISRGGAAAMLASVGMDDVKAIVTDGAFSSDSFIEHLMRRFATIFAKIRIVAENHPPTFWRFLRWLLFRECRRKYGCVFPSARKAMIKLGRRPVLLIHGEKDAYIPIAQPQALYDVADGPKKLWIVPGAKHNQSVAVQPEEYARQICEFFDDHLAPFTSPAPSTEVAFPRNGRPVTMPRPALATLTAREPIPQPQRTS